VVDRLIARIVGRTLLVSGLLCFGLAVLWGTDGPEDHAVFEGTSGRFSATDGEYQVLHSSAVNCQALDIEVVRVDGAGGDLVRASLCPAEGASVRSDWWSYAYLELHEGDHLVSASQPIVVADRSALQEAHERAGFLFAISGAMVAGGLTLTRRYPRV